MATRGRKPKPTAMKELEGNPGKHPLNTSEPKPNKKAPACPKWLEPEAKKEWRRLAKQMEAIGILTEVDMAAFAGYCQARLFLICRHFFFIRQKQSNDKQHAADNQ